MDFFLPCVLKPDTLPGMARRNKTPRFSTDKIISWLQENPGAHAAGELARSLGARRHERRDFLCLLADMADRGLLERIKGDRYRLVARKRLEGTLSRHRDGYGFLLADSADGPKVFLPARELREAMEGDRLAVLAWRDSRGRYEGRVEQVLNRAHSELVGVFQRRRHDNLVVPMGREPVPPLVIPPWRRPGGKTRAGCRCRDSCLSHGRANAARSRDQYSWRFARSCS